ncbi:pheromone precursor 2 [Fusarium heterosporum]|uniref:Pheromone 2 n=1 Tax=Fusarium heterosporum TaxID=42747 RepID=A0A8H5TLZ4_FUSHE|nr:pheromone precursor 2 [Fusarium heterosporum]
MPSTKNTSAQTPGYPLSCTVMAKPTKGEQTPGYPLSCSVMKKPAASGQTPGYPLSCTVITLTPENDTTRQALLWPKGFAFIRRLEEYGDDMARRGFIGLDFFFFTWL